MRHVAAAVICAGVFVAYGLFCLAIGWKNLGGAVPVVLLALALGWLWRKVASEPKQTSIR